MKRATLLLLLTIGAVYTQTTTGTCSTTTNKFLAMISSQDSTAVLSAPLTGTAFTICNEIWSTAGTCCDVTKVTALFNTKMTNQMKKGFDDFIGGLKNVGMSLDKIKNLGGANADTNKNRLNQAFNAGTVASGTMTTEQSVSALGAADTFKSDVETFKTNGKACFEALKENSGKMFCYGCSASTTDATAMSQSDGSSAITQASCNALLEKCHSTWRFMFRIGGMMEAVAMMNKAIAVGKMIQAGQTPPPATSFTSSTSTTTTTTSSTTSPPPSGTTTTTTTSTSGTTSGTSGTTSSVPNAGQIPNVQIPDKPCFGGISKSDAIAAWDACKALTDSTCTEAMKAKLCQSNFNAQKPPKNANNNNMGESMMGQLPSDQSGLPPVPPGSTAPTTNTAAATTAGTTFGRRELQSSSASGDTSVSANGADLTKKTTTPSSSASVDSSSTSTGSNGMITAFSAVFAVLATALLN